MLQIWGFCNSYWELRKQRPKLKKLKKLLMENPYEGPALAGQEENTENRVNDYLVIISHRLWSEAVSHLFLQQCVMPAMGGQEDGTDQIVHYGFLLD